MRRIFRRRKRDAVPDLLAPLPRRMRGVRRPNRMPLIIVVIIAAAVAAAIGYTYQQRMDAQQVREAEIEESTRVPEPASPREHLDNIPRSGVIPSDVRSVSVIDGSAINRAAGSPSPAGDPVWEAYRQRTDQQVARREEAVSQAMQASTRIGGAGAALESRFAGPGAGMPAILGIGGLESQSALGGFGGSGGRHTPSESLPLQGLAGYGGIASDDAGANGQEQKRQFLRRPEAGGGSPKTPHILLATRQPPLSPDEVKAGTVIPAVLIGGINSDLPGQIIAQVAESVYDTASGKRVLIPQGARLIGVYDNGVTMGQERVLVAWTRVIFPDGSSLSLDTMPGADQSGNGGFQDQVNNHYGRIFGNALLLSLFSAGVQVSQPQAVNGQNISSQQTLAAAIGQQLGQLGMQMAQRNMQIQPTLEIRPGYRFNVMVTKDVVLPPWQTGSRG